MAVQHPLLYTPHQVLDLAKSRWPYVSMAQTGIELSVQGLVRPSKDRISYFSQNIYMLGRALLTHFRNFHGSKFD